MTDLTTHDRKKGAFYGALLGDALGVTHEFTPFAKMSPAPYEIVGGGPFDFPLGHGSDDTDMLMCGINAYDADGVFDIERMIDNMLAWGATRPADIGRQTKTSLVHYFIGTSPPANEEAQGNGGLMRAAAHALMATSGRDAWRNANNDTYLTHPSSEASYCSATYAAALYEVIHGGDIPTALEDSYYGAYPTPVAEHGGHCVHSMALALWALENAERLGFEATLSHVIRTGGDTDTNGAIAGAMIGAVTGYDAIPERWLERLVLPPGSEKAYMNTAGGNTT